MAVSVLVVDDSPIARKMLIKALPPDWDIEITQAANGTFVGHITEILQSDKGPNPVCSACSGSNKDKPVRGMTILWNLTSDGTASWSGGTILDPANGKTYKSKMKLDGKTLSVSGCVTVFCKTQTWTRVK